MKICLLNITLFIFLLTSSNFSLFANLIYCHQVLVPLNVTKDITFFKQMRIVKSSRTHIPSIPLTMVYNHLNKNEYEKNIRQFQIEFEAQLKTIRSSNDLPITGTYNLKQLYSLFVELAHANKGTLLADFFLHYAEAISNRLQSTEVYTFFDALFNEPNLEVRTAAAMVVLNNPMGLYNIGHKIENNQVPKHSKNLTSDLSQLLGYPRRSVNGLDYKAQLDKDDYQLIPLPRIKNKNQLVEILKQVPTLYKQATFYFNKRNFDSTPLKDNLDTGVTQSLNLVSSFLNQTLNEVLSVLPFSLSDKNRININLFKIRPLRWYNILPYAHNDSADSGAVNNTYNFIFQMGGHPSLVRGKDGSFFPIPKDYGVALKTQEKNRGIHLGDYNTDRVFFRIWME